MKTTSLLARNNELFTLREGIKLKYEQFHSVDKIRFPIVEFNTNRANYAPLRDSFEEEFFVIRGIDRQQQSIHIPSVHTLSLLFTDDRYVPSQKIWNTCKVYTEEVSVPETIPPKPASLSLPEEANQSQTLVSARMYRWFLPGGLFFLMLLLVGLWAMGYVSRSTLQKSELSVQNAKGLNRLVIIRPTAKGRVSPTFIAHGLAGAKETVWLVTHFEDTDLYWVQFPALSSDMGVWLQAIEISGAKLDKAGKKHELRAFVNPANELRVGDVLYSWPKAERSTDIVEIIMDPQAPLGIHGN